MARDKLITIRIEGEKREAFNQLAKFHNTDTASLLYDFISGCLDNRIDISLVTGKKQWIDKIDNRIDSERIDKLETATQRIDNWIGALSERLNDWLLRSDRRLTDCDRELSDKITNLEQGLNALAIQLAIQLDSQRIDKIDMDSKLDSKLDRQQKNPDMEPVPTVETADNVESVETISSIETITVEAVEPISSIEPLSVEIEDSKKKIPLPDTLIASQIETVESVCEPALEAIKTVPKTHKDIAKLLGLKNQTTLNYWIKKGEIPAEYTDRCQFNPEKTKILWITP